MSHMLQLQNMFLLEMSDRWGKVNVCEISGRVVSFWLKT